MKSLLFGISPLDPFTYLAVLLVLAVSAVAGELSAGATRRCSRSGGRPES